MGQFHTESNCLAQVLEELGQGADVGARLPDLGRRHALGVRLGRGGALPVAAGAPELLDVVIVGAGSEERKLRAMAGSTIEFLGRVGDEEVQVQYDRCRALLFPGVEDFGIVPLEAMACGKPVIAFGRGGASETVIDGVTGVLVPEQTSESLQSAIRTFRREAFDSAAIRAHALRFDKKLFKASLEEEIFSRWESHCQQRGVRS